MQFRALQKRAKKTRKNKQGKNLSKKRFGKSIANKAPALFVTVLEKALQKHGGALIHINTWKAKASQFDQKQCKADFETFLKLHDKEIHRLTGKKMPSSVGLAN